MPKLAANISMLFTELDFIDRFAAASRAGFRGVEYIGPYAYEAAVVRGALRDAELHQVLFNLPVGDWSAGERGIACLPDRAAEFRAGVATAIEYAHALDCRLINCLAGKRPPTLAVDEARRTLVDNLRYAASELERAGIALVIEAINTFDIPGFFLTHSAQAFALIDEVGSSNLTFQYDIYHMQRMEGELIATLRANIARIGHIQVADNPGRHEPGSGEIAYPFVLAELDRAGYTGWIGCEYIPANGTAAGLGWARPYLAATTASVS